MTNGTSQGLFIVVAIVIFGVFVLLSQTIFGDQLSNGVTGLFENAIEQSEYSLASSQRATPQRYFNYTVNTENKTATITKYHGEYVDVIIPKTIIDNGVRYTVTTIGTAAFYGVGGTSELLEKMDIELDSVIIPNTVTHIESHAFARNNFGSVHIPDSVREIDRYAFATSRLTSVHIGNGIEVIGDFAFAGNQLTSVELPAGVSYNNTSTRASFGSATITYR